MTLHALPASLDAASYTPHTLHSDARAWVETNCYIDVWIEVLNALQLEPAACLGMVLANDFEGDQWTFYKPPHEDLAALYGLEVHELNVWRSILDNACEQLSRGRLVLTEIDSFHLPDTAGTDYRRNHVKTTIAIQALDLEAQTLGYFHNRSYHQLQGEDFVNLFRVGMPHDPSFMPFFAEFVRIDRVQRRTTADVAAIAHGLLRKHFARRPDTNPVTAYLPRFLDDIEQLKTQGLTAYHAYAFANLRQLGSGAELAAHHLRWLETGLRTEHNKSYAPSGYELSAIEFEAISNTTKMLLLKTARAVSSKKPADLVPMMETLAGHWDAAMGHLAKELR
jgi:hypothetical protein